MAYKFTSQRKIAIILLLILSFNLLMPSISYALTSGPAQPETKGFQPAGVSDMVDLQTGEFKYNIPLLDIDGYPINLDYQSGTGIDDEASWVGLGWNLNPGAINRQVRGLPDDFSGDMVETDHYVKPKITVGGRATAKIENRGGIKANGSLTIGLFNDNYTGIGAEFGVNAGLSFSIGSDDMLTMGLGFGALSNTQTGVDATVSPYACFSLKQKTDNNLTINPGLTGSLGYNTRGGLKNLTLGTTFGVSESQKDGDQVKGQASSSYDLGGISISYNTDPIQPSIQIPYKTTYGSFSFDVGLAAGTVFGSLGGTGYESVREVKDIVNIKPAYGFLYAERAKTNPDAVMDFIREKDNPISTDIPNIALPIHTPDLWTYTSQVGAGQFRLYRGGTGAFTDNQASDESDVSTSGVDLGVGAWAHVGVTHYNQETHNDTRKWQKNNGYLPQGDFEDASTTDPTAQPAYFRQIGEKNLEDSKLSDQFGGTQPVKIGIDGVNALPLGYASTSSPIRSIDRRNNKTVISYLTAHEASKAAFDKNILAYSPNTIADGKYPNNYLADPMPTATLPREDPIGNTIVHKPNHISEITVTKEDGKRMIYGIPVYNLVQDEYTFAVGTTGKANENAADYKVDPVTSRHYNQVAVPAGIANPQGDPLGIDNYYQKESKPAYATSFLLTEILSPDYVDKTNNGISADDLGTAIKFNYSKIDNFKWRSPYQNATLNKCLLADPDDDKGSIVYGEKEIWYTSSIESKTKIAYFITGERNDALGVSDWQYGGLPADINNATKQRYLKEIRLYSKADMSKPIKVVKFEYSYQLCPQVPNYHDFTNQGIPAGKLTLCKIWFEYGNSTKGADHPYVFHYKNATSHYLPAVNYSYLATDRWGVYKQETENPNGLDNEQFPYTTQDSSYVNQNAALWHLNKIELPTGGVIAVNYESGDYAYVQNKRAMVMSPVQGLIQGDGSPVDNNSLQYARGVSINITNAPPGGADPTTWFENKYLNGSHYLYTKFYVQMSTPNKITYGTNYFDFVPCYCDISRVTISNGVAKVFFKEVTAGDVTSNPITIAAWQHIKNEYPRYAYPGFDNRVPSASNSVLVAVSAIVTAARNLSELKSNFYQKAYDNKYANNVSLPKSFVKLTKQDGHKMGGPARVKSVRIYDQWNTMSGGAPDGAYGQSYDYTTIDNGQTISSGVATYEPSIGNDENPLKQPITYGQASKGAITNYYNLEEPFAESLYPAPAIGYSKVTVNDLGSDGVASNKTGYIENEFYTAKDFPVKVNVLPITNIPNNPGNLVSFTGSNIVSQLCLSQGYSIELNDMHGKPKAVTVYNQSGAEISSTHYNYNAIDNGGVSTLNNAVNIIDNTGHETNQVLGRDVEFFTDVREQESTNIGQAINVGGDFFPIPPFIPFFGLPHNPISDNNDVKIFHSICAVKVIQSYGILKSVEKRQNGSSITTENLAFDGLTGEPIVTRTQNEFNKNIYSVNLPAYWAYNGMGPAYKNLGVLLSNFTTNGYGEVNNQYVTYMQAGDEICDLTTGTHYWVIDNPSVSNTGNTKKLITADGNIVPNYIPSKLVKIIRSGYRNMLDASTSSIVCLNNPIINNQLQLAQGTDLTTLQVINASANTYDENWSVSKVCPSQLIENTTQSFNLCPVVFDGGQEYANIFDNNNNSYVLFDPPKYNIYNNWSIYLGKPVEDCTPSDIQGNYIGVDVCVNIPVSKIYYIGYISDGYLKAQMEGVPAFNISLSNSGSGFDVHYVLKPIFITAGQHILHTLFQYTGLEIYDNTFDNFFTNKDNFPTGLNIVFSLGNLIGQHNLYSYRSASNQLNGSDAIYHYHYPNGTIPTACGNDQSGNLTSIVNPYVQGYLGNWRPYQTNVYQQSRNYNNILDATQKQVNVKNAGYINNFYSYWKYDATLTNGKPLGWVKNTNATSWTTANTVTLYDKYGQQLENKDALGRYSAAKFDFNGELPSAVASNAMNREIYAGSFEDNGFVPGTIADASNQCNSGEFIVPATGIAISQMANSSVAHTGNNSKLLPSSGGLTLTTTVHDMEQKTTNYLSFDAMDQYITQSTPGLYPGGFAPAPNKKYIFNAWINDNQPGSKDIESLNFNLLVNGVAVADLKCKAIVEGWKLVEGTFTTGAVASALTINMAPKTSGAVYIDDIRMHPFDAHMKTYAYDAKTMRLMAELDENNFATFYEYDDEGLLIRVKKETEKGIMTLKESRSSYRLK